MLAIYILVVYLYIGIAVGFYNYLTAPKQSHKQIIIGAKGQMLKEIGTKSRLEIEKLLGKRVSLDLFVKVREDWRENGSFVNNLYGDLGELN